MVRCSGVVRHLGVGIVPIGVGISFCGGGADACGGIVALLRGEGGLPLGGLCFGEGDVALGLEDLGAFVALGVRKHGPLGGVTADVGGSREVGHGA
jgi:hypothetical protein